MHLSVVPNSPADNNGASQAVPCPPSLRPPVREASKTPGTTARDCLILAAVCGLEVPSIPPEALGLGANPRGAHEADHTQPDLSPLGKYVRDTPPPPTTTAETMCACQISLVALLSLSLSLPLSCFSFSSWKKIKSQNSLFGRYRRRGVASGLREATTMHSLPALIARIGTVISAQIINKTKETKERAELSQARWRHSLDVPRARNPMASHFLQVSFAFSPPAFMLWPDRRLSSQFSLLRFFHTMHAGKKKKQVLSRLDPGPWEERLRHGVRLGTGPFTIYLYACLSPINDCMTYAS